MDNKTILGIIAVILGILIIAFPIASQLVLSVFAGLGFFILGIYYLLEGASFWQSSKWSSAGYIILGILGIILGFMLFLDVFLFDVLIAFYIYIIGFMLLIAGILGLVSRYENISKASSAIMLILGIVVVAIGFLAIENPLFVSLIIGISLILDGITLAVVGETY